MSFFWDEITVFRVFDKGYRFVHKQHILQNNPFPIMCCIYIHNDYICPYIQDFHKV